MGQWKSSATAQLSFNTYNMAKVCCSLPCLLQFNVSWAVGCPTCRSTALPGTWQSEFASATTTLHTRPSTINELRNHVGITPRMRLLCVLICLPCSACHVY